MKPHPHHPQTKERGPSSSSPTFSPRASRPPQPHLHVRLSLPTPDAALLPCQAQGNARIVKVLCEAKATVTLRCPEGTALDLAHRHGHKEVAKSLGRE